MNTVSSSACFFAQSIYLYHTVVTLFVRCVPSRGSLSESFNKKRRHDTVVVGYGVSPRRDWPDFQNSAIKRKERSVHGSNIPKHTRRPNLSRETKFPGANGDREKIVCFPC